MFIRNIKKVKINLFYCYDENLKEFLCVDKKIPYISIPEDDENCWIFSNTIKLKNAINEFNKN